MVVNPLADSIRQRILEGREPIAIQGDRAAYQLPNGMRIVLSQKRQAKKALMTGEGLSSRQFRRKKKKFQREAKASEVTPVGEAI